MKKNLTLFLLITIVTGAYTQNTYYGIPESQQELYSGDIIIINEIGWQNSFKHISNVGEIQLAKIKKFVSERDTLSLEFSFHSFHGVKDYNAKISEVMMNHVKQYLSGLDNSDSVKFIPCGSSLPLFPFDLQKSSFQEKIRNNRIEIRIVE